MSTRTTFGVPGNGTYGTTPPTTTVSALVGQRKRVRLPRHVPLVHVADHRPHRPYGRGRASRADALVEVDVRQVPHLELGTSELGDAA